MRVPKQHERVYNLEQTLIRDARKQLKLSQQVFADLINTPVATLRDWEQGRYSPLGVNSNRSLHIRGVSQISLMQSSNSK